MTVTTARPKRTPVREIPGLWSYERALERHGFLRVAGADEAGRGASAGPLVAAAAILSKPIRDLNDSKALSAATRDKLYDQIVTKAHAYSIVIVSAADIDRWGLQVSNIAALRRAVSMLDTKPSYVLTDGFPVRGMPAPSLAVWKGDQVSASIAAASILAKVTRDRILCELDVQYPDYGFATHKGYNTPEHLAALDLKGPCPEHRRSFVTITSRMRDDGDVTTVAIEGGGAG